MSDDLPRPVRTPADAANCGDPTALLSGSTTFITVGGLVSRMTIRA